MKTYGSAQFYRGLWCDLTSQHAEIHMRTDANNLVTTASTTHLPEQKETVHMIQMLIDKKHAAEQWMTLHTL
eukprot:6169455-Amphidinium_carterae.1